MKNIALPILIVLILSSFCSKAQLVADTTINSSGLAKALSYYIGSIGINATIYSGSENADPRYPINDGTPFFHSEEAVSGDILYDGILYKAIPLWYDIVHNEVAVQHPTMNSRIALNNNKITYFALGDQVFVPANRKLQGTELMPDNFYKVLHDGKTALLGRYTKKMFEIIRESQYVTNYSKQQNEYFLLKDDKYYLIKNLSALLNILGDKKQELQQHLRESQQYLRSNSIRVKETPEQSMVRVLAFYDKISL